MSGGKPWGTSQEVLVVSPPLPLLHGGLGPKSLPLSGYLLPHLGNEGLGERVSQAFCELVMVTYDPVGLSV